jgi:hypothetical protein
MAAATTTTTITTTTTTTTTLPKEYNSDKLQDLHHSVSITVTISFLMKCTYFNIKHLSSISPTHTLSSKISNTLLIMTIYFIFIVYKARHKFSQNTRNWKIQIRDGYNI